MRLALSRCVSQPPSCDLDERDARLDQPASEQAAFAEAARAVGLAHVAGSWLMSNALAFSECISAAARL